MTHYDYLIVGAGIYGAVFTYEATRRGYRCLVIDKRDHIGGNVYTYKEAGIDVHAYGAHIFHTDKKDVWDYLNRFTGFIPFINRPMARNEGSIYSLPFNMHTFYQVFGTITPDEAKARIEQETRPYQKEKYDNLEEKALSLIGPTLYDTLVKGYSEKQWGMDAKEIPAFVISRLPLRFTYDNNYFKDTYQGIPDEGYTVMIERMLEGADIKLETDFLKDPSYYQSLAKTTIYTGMIDALFDYDEGALDYRSLDFKTKTLDTDNYQGNAVINYTNRRVPYTRIIEHKHFKPFKDNGKSIVTKEYPAAYEKGKDPYYPINNKCNNALFTRYHKRLQSEFPNMIVGGRLGLYRYMDMDVAVETALKAVKEHFRDA